MFSNRASRLDGDAEEPSAKRPRLDGNATTNANSKASSDSPLHVLHDNHTCVSLNGFKGDNVSFLNNVASQTEPTEDIIPSNEKEGVNSDK